MRPRSHWTLIGLVVSGLCVVPLTGCGESGVVAAATQLRVVTQPSTSAVSGERLARQPSVSVVDEEGTPVARAGVGIEVALSGAGVLEGTTVQTTDASGVARFSDLSIVGGMGDHVLIFSASGFEPVTSTRITIRPGAVAAMTKTAGDDQRASPGQPVAVQPRVQVVDAHGNPLQGVAVTFSVASGGGSVTGSPAMTDAAGHASAMSWVLGPAEGPNTLTASTEGAPSVAFTATAVATLPAAVDDSVTATSGPGEPFHTALNTPLTIASGAADSLTANDDPGTGASVTSFGAIQLNDGAGTLGAPDSPVTAYDAGQTAQFGDGSLTVHVDGSFTFVPPTNYTGLLRFRYRLANTAGWSDASVTLAVGQRPVAVEDWYDVLGNVPITVPGPSGLFANDLGDRLSFVGAAHHSGVTGTVSIGIATGALNYTPPRGQTGEGVFLYTVRNGFGAVQGTLTLSIGGMIWFVDATAVAPGNGRLSAPFRSLNEFVTSGGGQPGDTIFLYESASPYTGGIELKPQQRLIGHDASETLATLAGVTVPRFSPPLPVMNPNAGAAVTLSGTEGGVRLASDNHVHGLTIDISQGTGVSGESIGTLVMRDVSVASDQGALFLANGIADVKLRSTTSRGGELGVFLGHTEGSLELGQGSISGDSGIGLHLVGGAADVTYFGAISAGGSRLPVDSMLGNGGYVTLHGDIVAAETGIRIRDDARGFSLFGPTKVREIHIRNVSSSMSFGQVTIENRSGVGIDIHSAASQLFFGRLRIDNPAGVAMPAIRVEDAALAAFWGCDIDLGWAGVAAGIRALRSRVQLVDTRIMNVGGHGLHGDEETDWLIASLTIVGTGGNAISSASGEIDIGNSMFTNIGADGIVLGAGDAEHRLRIVDSRFESVGASTNESFAIRASAPWASIVLDNVSFGLRDLGILMAASGPAPDPGSDVCVSLTNTSRDPGTELDPEYILDGTLAPMRFESPTTGISGNVARSNVMDVPPGTCAVPGPFVLTSATAAP